MKSGGSKYSTIISNMRKIAAPKLKVGNQKADILLEWTEVPNADRYYIYKFSYEKGKFVKVKTTTSCKYVDKDDYSMGFEYKIKAVCDGNSNANSAYSNVGYGHHIYPKPKAPVASGKILPDGTAQITWNKVAGAESYIVYYFMEDAESKDDNYYVTDTEGLSAINENHYEGETLYYVVVAYNGHNYSDYSNVVKL